MDHLAIMSKQLQLLPKILQGEKTIESRWYKTRKAPFNKIKVGDIVYFKDSGAPVTIKSLVKKVIQFDNLSEQRIYDLLHEYEKELGINADEYYNSIKNKKYGIIIYLDKVEQINPFQIDKKGFGNQSSWITIDNIATITIYS